MSGFKTKKGAFKGLGIIVYSYEADIFDYHFYNNNEEWLVWRATVLSHHKHKPDAIYCFNSEKPLKEQAKYAEGSAFGDLLQLIIRENLINPKW